MKSLYEVSDCVSLDMVHYVEKLHLYRTSIIILYIYILYYICLYVFCSQQVFKSTFLMEILAGGLCGCMGHWVYICSDNQNIVTVCLLQGLSEEITC